MNKKFGFIKEINIKNMMESIVKEVLTFRLNRLPVLAEEPTNNTGATATSTGATDPTSTVTGTDPTSTEPTGTEPNKYQVNFEDLVAKARKEEKDKLYPQIKDLKEENGKLTEKVNAQLLTIESKDKEITALKAELEEAKNATSKSDDDKVKALKKEIKDLKAEKEALEKDKVDVTEIENNIRAEYEVKLYREQKLREGGNEIIPELVTGVTKEDIDASFEVAKNRYNDIIKNVVSTTVSNLPTNNVETGKFSAKDFKPEDIANMSPAEWAEKRKLLGLK